VISHFDAYVIGFDINTLPEFGERGYKTFA